MTPCPMRSHSRHLPGAISILRFICLAVSFANLVGCGFEDKSNATNAMQPCEFGDVESLGSLVNSAAFDGSPTVSSDETELFFTSERNGLTDLFLSTRDAEDAQWGEPVGLGAPVDDASAGDFSLRLSSDGKALYFASNRTGGFGAADMYVATRVSRGHAWSPAVNLGPKLNTAAFEAFPTPSADGMALYFNRSTSFDSQDSDLWISTRTRLDGAWSEPQRLPDGINSHGAEFSPSLSADGNTLYFASDRGGHVEIWVSSRTEPDQDWGSPRRLAEAINQPRSMTLAPFISSDQRSLYFMSARAETSSIEVCTPATCFDRVDLFLARAVCAN